MPWNPETYNKFKNIRYQPFYDLITLIQPVKAMRAIDLGCGTGEQTAILADKFTDADFLGVDSSPEMLSDSSALETERLRFKLSTTEDVVGSARTWDLIFSNAALQWSDDHHKLFPGLINRLNPEGQFAIQMPVQNENLLNKILLDLAIQEPFQVFLNGWRRTSPLLSMDQYANIMFEAGLNDIQVIQKVYPIIVDEHKTLYDFISGSALIPYLERLEDDEKGLFIQSFKNNIAKNFPKLPTIYAFKRLLLYGKKR